jgi:ribonuclease BN (tRNA processing enzyme)
MLREVKVERRAFLGIVAPGSFLPALSRSLLQAAGRTRLILLGTAGGPSPKKNRAAPSQVIIAQDGAYVIDCGNGVARQMALAGVPLNSIRHVFITHHHSDHNADYGTLLLLAWSTGLRTVVDTWGPPPLARITQLFLEMSAPDIDVRQADEGHVPLGPLIRPHELTATTTIVESGAMRVRCTAVSHPMVKSALAYRFDAPDRSIVISGDTAPSDDLIGLARDADLLVHEAMYLPAVGAVASTGSDAAKLRRHLLASHTSLEDVGRIASEARVKTLVLSHLVPAESPPIPDDIWLAGARKHFDGKIVVGKDLMEV